MGDFKDGANSGDDYSYDANGNLTADNNKNISTIVYNHLNLPQTITISGKGSIDYVYDAAGNKLKKIVHEAGKLDKTTLYLLGTYEDDVLQFLPMEEGRIRFEKATTGTCPPLPDRFIYDYFIKDHLGNVRMVLTEQQESKCYPGATVEDSRYQTEDDVYDIQNPRRIDKTVTGASQSSFEDKLYRTHGGLTGEKTGLGAVIKVMSGDEVKIYAESFYQLPGGDPGQPLNMVIGDFLSVFTGNNTVSAVKGAINNSQVTGLGNNNQVLQNFINRTPAANQAKAYLNWVLFDEQLKVVNVGADPVVAGGGYRLHDYFINNPVNVTKNGYLYVFVSNESNLPVYFDNLTLTHTNGPIMEETHYYPFGLTMAGISSKAAGGVENKKKYNGIEKEDDLEINIYDAQFRELDAQTGRWWQIDPVTDGYENLSPYASMYDNPLTYSDPLGDEGQACCGDFFDDLLDIGEDILISGSGVMNGGLNTVSFGLISSDPFNFRNKLSGDKLALYDRSVQVGQIAPVLVPGGGRGPAKTPSLQPVNGSPIPVTTTRPVIGVPVVNTQQSNPNSNNSGSSNSSNNTNKSQNKPRNAPQQTGTPNSSKIEAKDANGKTTKYSTYGRDGSLKKQVQVDKGTSRHGVQGATKKVPVYNTNPNTGKKHMNGYKIKKALPAETPPGSI